MAWALLALINPAHHGATPEGMARYKIEPYVMAADVYSVAPHTGRGGWSWYTGSAGWMYRQIVESLLGLRLVTSHHGARLLLTPCLPEAWPGCSVEYRYRETRYLIELIQTSREAGAIEVQLDGELQIDGGVPLQNDRKTHHVVVRLPAGATVSPVP